MLVRLFQVVALSVSIGTAATVIVATARRVEPEVAPTRVAANPARTAVRDAGLPAAAQSPLARRRLPRLYGPSTKADPHLARMFAEAQARSAGVLGILGRQAAGKIAAEEEEAEEEQIAREQERPRGAGPEASRDTVELSGLLADELAVTEPAEAGIEERSGAAANESRESVTKESAVADAGAPSDAATPLYLESTKSLGGLIYRAVEPRARAPRP